ncbi:hypothetical protein [Nocardia vaccinii]|uniref:hypothetical protein n=1 Tax=Nocardia vaccinii TaxID=1822 RepID=UPI0012F4C061|nr:hypothetical protein [Nocardia vaccinii]
MDDIRALAAERGWDLRGVFLERSDESFPLLLASLGLSGFAAVVVPSIAHVSGWLDLLRQSADVWTLDPPCRWPLETADRRVG